MSEEQIEFIKVTKLDAAKRQLRTAIGLWFHDGDPVAIHALLYAAHEIIHRIYRRAGHKDLLFDLDPEVTIPTDIETTPEERQVLRNEFPIYLKTAANFFKHAERETNPDDSIVFSPNVNESFIVICLLGLERIGEKSDAFGRTFKFWHLIHGVYSPDDFQKAGIEPMPADTLQEWRRLNKREFFKRYIAGLRQRGVH
jgi:hypothetical protein